MAIEKTQVVAAIISLGVANQPRYIYNQLRQRGYDNPYQPPGGVLESELFKLYAVDKEQFWSIMNGLNFDQTVTNSSTDGDTLVTLAKDQGFASDNTRGPKLKDAWDWLIATVAGKDTSTTAPTIVETKSINVGAVIGLIVIAGLIVTVAYFAFFKKS